MITKVNPSEYGIAPQKAQELMSNLPQILEERNVLEAQYSEIIKMDIEDKSTSKKASELRKLIKDNRTKGILVWHKTNKEFFLRGGQFIDAIKNREIAVNEGMEDKLEQIEKYQEIKEKERKEALNKQRILEIEKFKDFVPFGVNLGELDESEYNKLFNGAKLQYDAHLEQIKKEEEERERIERVKLLHIERKEIALPFYQYWSDFEKQLNFGEQSQSDFDSFMKRIKYAKEEAEKIAEQQRLENEKLKAEAEAKEKQIAEERAKAEAEKKAIEEKAKAEKSEADRRLKEAEEKARIEREKLENELAEKKRIEAEVEKARLAEEEKKRKEAEKLAKAPIKKQLKIWVDSFSLPNSEIEHQTKKDIEVKFKAFIQWANSEIEKI